MFTGESIPLERVKWLDSRGATDHWIRIEDLAENHALEMTSVGFIIFENEIEIQIAPHIGIEENFEKTQVCGVMTIPKIAIKQRTRLDDER